MKRGLHLSILLLMLLVLALPGLIADEITQNLQSRIIETFDDPTGGSENSSRWVLRASKFASKIETENGVDEYPKMAFVDAWPEAVWRIEPEGEDLKSIGVHGKFDRLGWNFIELIPVDDNDEPQGIPIPGRVQSVDLWAWGSNYEYYLEGHLMDYNGDVHVLNFGSLDYKGWRNLTAPIPPQISQSVRYLPSLKQLQLIKLVIWTRPHEKVDDFYVYIDQIKVLTDLFEAGYDGESLASPEFTSEAWANGQ